MKKNTLQNFILLSIIFFLAAFSCFGVLSQTSLAEADCTGDYELISGVCVPTADATGLSDTTFSVILINILNWMLAIIGILSVLMFVVSGFQYITAQGDEKQVDVAKKNIRYSITGLAVALVSFLIVELVDFLISGGMIGPPAP